jgi:hypothetical protein
MKMRHPRECLRYVTAVKYENELPEGMSRVCQSWKNEVLDSDPGSRI